MHLIMPKRGMTFFLTVLSVLTLLTACAMPATSFPPEEVVQPIALDIQPEVSPTPESIVCESEIDLATEAALRKLTLGNEWHSEGRYSVSLEAYESVLVEHASLLADAYALWGIIALRLDRKNPDYSRETARTVSYVLDQRIRDAADTEAKGEASLLQFSVGVMLLADASKDNVVAENKQLRSELAQREEAIQRLRDLTVGR